MESAREIKIHTFDDNYVKQFSVIYFNVTFIVLIKVISAANIVIKKKHVSQKFDIDRI